MKTRYSSLFLVFALLSTTLSAQISGFFDDFSDGSLDTLWNEVITTIWTSSAAETYSLSEANGVLQIDYLRNATTPSTARFNFEAPEEIVVSENPRLRFEMRSTTTSTIRLRVAYNERWGAFEDLTFTVLGDNQWRDYGFDLDPAKFGSYNLQRLSFYADENSSSNRSGDFQFDNLKIAGFVLTIPHISATTVDGNNIQLNWASSDSAGTLLYKVHRSNEPDFDPAVENLVTGVINPEFLNIGLDPFQTFFYKVIPVDTLNEEYQASAEVMAQTYQNGILPVVTITQETMPDVPLYEEFALELDLENVAIFNPYDPSDIDVFGHFISPSGSLIRINAFYDNYQAADQWRLYFAPFERGEWRYKLFVADVGGSDSTDYFTINAVASDHHGPLQVSSQNPDYLIYHDGTPFYGRAVYYPWNIQPSWLDQLKEHDLNLVGYWNSTYDGAGNGGGRYLFESTRSGLGRYDQAKMGRLEEILAMLEQRDMMLMYAIWAHPFLRDGAPGWDPIDYDLNPYKNIVGAGDFYTDSLAWEYQLKNYRYLIARFAHHRSLGIWELVNEMHGTTGFVEDLNGSLAWIKKVNDYMYANDPYQRPTTASFGSVDIFSDRDVAVDIANRHYYELQGFYTRPYNDNIRDGLFNVVNTYQGLKQSGTRPAMLGEAGYTSMFSAVGSSDYTREFHNAFWSGLATGMASSPFWWDYTTLSIFTDEVMETYINLGRFVENLPLSTTPMQRYAVEQADANIYSMANDSMAIGWVFRVDSDFIPGVKFNVPNLETGTFNVEWFNTWTGSVEHVDTLVAVDGFFKLTVFDMPVPERDIAFKVRKIENGTTAAKVNLILPVENLVAADMPVLYPLYVYITDGDGKLVETSVQVTLTLTGNGQLSENTVTTTNGFAQLGYSIDTSGGESFSVIATSDGLQSGFLNDIKVTDNENEPDLPTDFKLHQNYPNPFNPSTVIRYQLPVNSQVNLEVFTLSGQLVATLVDDVQTAGSYEVNFEASSLASGLYLYRLNAGNFIQTQRMTLIK